MTKQLLTIAVALLFITTAASADIFWNPTQSDPYVATGGNGTWSDTDVWWDGASNITAATDPGDGLVYEGAGDVGGGTFQPQRLTFSNLTGDYNINHNLELRLDGTHAVHVTGGSHDVYLQSLGYSSGTGSNRSVRNDGTGTVTVNTVLRRFGGSATNLAFVGDGDFAINGSGSTGGALIKNGAGLLTIDQNNITSFSNGVEMNAGSLFMDVTAASLTWNDGILLYLLSGVDSTSNTITLNNELTKGSGTDFVFDFQSSGLAGETYTLANFASTDFLVSDFTATNVADGFFSLSDTSLTYTIAPIPEPATAGLLALGSLALLARRRRPEKA